MRKFMWQEKPINRPGILACAAVVIMVLAPACDTRTTELVDVPPQLKVIAGELVTDTVQAAAAQRLVAEVKRRDGKPAVGVIVRFEVLAHANLLRASESSISICPLTPNGCSSDSRLAIDTTDADGRVQAQVRMGTVAGTGRVLVLAPNFGIADTATFTITPGAGVRLKALSTDTTLDIGTTVTLRGHVLDRFNNVRADVATVSAGSGNTFAIDAASGNVSARELGIQWLYSRFATFADSSRVRVLPPGRLVVWTGSSIRLINLDGKDGRTIVTGIESHLGTFPRFDGTGNA